MQTGRMAHFKAHKKNAPHVKSEIIQRQLQRLAYESVNETTEWLEIYEVKKAETA